MTNEKVYGMHFAKIYPLLVNKVVRKNRTQEELDQIIWWLTGYTKQQLDELLQTSETYADFFQNAPAMNPKRKQITGSVCGVRVETIKESLMQEIRYLDKLVDELAKGKTMEKILHKQ